VSEFLFHSARLPLRVLRDAFDSRAWAPWMLAVDDPDAPMPMTADADNIRVRVAGGAGKHSCEVPSWGMTRSVTVPIEYPGSPPSGPTRVGAGG
jgi:hypothetical protein